MISEKSAGVVVFRKDNNLKYLVLRYGAGHWDFPKGRMEPGESEIETALRELGEETGIKEAQMIPGFKTRIEYFFKRGSETVQKEVIFYLAETKGEEVMLSSEHVGHQWLGFDDAMKKVTYDSAKHVLKSAHGFLKQSKLGWFS